MRGKRSPNYPVISLDKAIELVRKFYNQFQRNSIPTKVAIEEMGYSTKSSLSKQLVASLAYYGLMDAEGQKEDRKLKISELGFNILRNPNLNERDVFIRSAALYPTIFKKIHTKYLDGIPQDELLKWDLEKTFDFNAKAIPDFIKVFKNTMSYGKVYEMSTSSADKVAEEKKPINIQETFEDINVKDSKDSLNFLSAPKIKKIAQPGQECEVAMYPVGKGITIRLIANGQVTQKSIMKLTKLLEINLDDFPEDVEQVEQ